MNRLILRVAALIGCAIITTFVVTVMPVESWAVEPSTSPTSEATATTAATDPTPATETTGTATATVTATATATVTVTAEPDEAHPQPVTLAGDDRQMLIAIFAACGFLVALAAALLVTTWGRSS